MSRRNRFLARTRENADLNQYWYSNATIAAMVEEIQSEATRAAFLSTPSVFFSLTDKTLQSNSCVFDYDKQWDKHEGYHFYDFHHPEDLDGSLEHSFDYFVVDPPFITHEVLELYCQAIDRLGAPGFKILWSSVAENLQFFSDRFEMTEVLFKPSIPKLVYQYSFFVNYHAAADSEGGEEGPLQVWNPEIPEPSD